MDRMLSVADIGGRGNWGGPRWFAYKLPVFGRMADRDMKAIFSILFGCGLAWQAQAQEITLRHELEGKALDILEFAGAEWRLVAMCIVWAIANRVQVRRGGSGA